MGPIPDALPGDGGRESPLSKPRIINSRRGVSSPFTTRLVPNARGRRVPESGVYSRRLENLDDRTAPGMGLGGLVIHRASNATAFEGRAARAYPGAPDQGGGHTHTHTGRQPSCGAGWQVRCLLSLLRSHHTLVWGVLPPVRAGRPLVAGGWALGVRPLLLEAGKWGRCFPPPLIRSRLLFFLFSLLRGFQTVPEKSDFQTRLDLRRVGQGNVQASAPSDSGQEE